jgi:hypothetical protein
MRLIKILFAVSIVLGLAISVLLTVGLLTSQVSYFVGAIWVSLLVGLVVLAGLLAGYGRVVRRLGTANERLAELRFLLERRYEQSRQRLDTLLETSHGLTEPSDSPTSRLSSNWKGRAELENLSARVQRSERRILGRLENELLAHDRQSQQLAELIERLQSTTDK